MNSFYDEGALRARLRKKADVIVVLAPDSFKESMTAAEAAEAMRQGVMAVFPDAVCQARPLADGGEGTSTVLAGAMGARPRVVRVRNAFGTAVEASFAVAGNGTCVMDVASVVGLEMLTQGERHIMDEATWGVGDLIKAALDDGLRHLIVGLGGSSTNDGGAGMLVSLGARLLDEDGREVDATPKGLLRLASVDLDGLDPRLADLSIEIACDVDNPLLGERGATAVFAPQKGATPDDLPALERALSQWARALDTASAGRGSHLGDAGAGAAGGLGFALLMVGGRARLGVDLIAEAMGLDDVISGADLVLTGEGSFDAQTGAGKAPWGVAQLARRHGVPVIAFAGRVASAPGDIFDAVVPIVPGPTTLDEALRDGAKNLAASVERAMRLARLQPGKVGE